MITIPNRNTQLQSDDTNLKTQFEEICEQLWITQGYKKTNIKGICDRLHVGISSFYKLYPSKEHLFLATLTRIHNRTFQSTFDIIKANPTKEGFVEAMKALFQEHLSRPLLYDTNSEDFKAFIGKLPPQTMENFYIENTIDFRLAVETANLKTKIDAEQALGVLLALLSILQKKERISKVCDPNSLFDFMIHTMADVVLE